MELESTVGSKAREIRALTENAGQLQRQVEDAVRGAKQTQAALDAERCVGRRAFAIVCLSVCLFVS
jgi:hypothetical protein